MFSRPILTAVPLLVASASALSAAITVSGVADKTKYTDSASFTVTADPNAATTTATLDGAAVAVGSAVQVTAKTYHELRAESRDAGGALVDSKLIRFLVKDSARGGSEDGIPPHTPAKSVDDAPSAFAGGTLRVTAPAAWPAGLPIPVATTLRGTDGESIWLNGKVKFDAFPTRIIQMRRGWGSGVMPAATTPGALQLGATLNGLAHNPSVVIEGSPVFTDVSGTISANTEWPANSRIRVASTLTIAAGAALTIGEGTIVLLYSGNGTAGTAAEIVSNGSILSYGTASNPVVFAPDTATGRWGGIELPAATSLLEASHTIFSGAGEDPTWFTTHTGYTTHKQEQALFLISGSGSGTAVGARLRLTNCYCFELGGQEMNSKTNTEITLTRTLMQRAVTCGELNGSKVTIDRSALIEFPSETAAFVDSDNDAIYLTNGELAISNTVLGFTKDDGVDSGGNGGDNPYTSASDVTPLVFTNNWFEGTFHEGNSLSGTRNVSHTGCVFQNCGQGVEDGYSSSSTGDGPNAVVDGCLFAGNMVAVRWGDNYGSGYSYNGSMEVKNSFLLNSGYRDTFSFNWHPTAANAWIYQTSATNTFGRAYFNVHDNHLTQPDAVNHPGNTTWNPVAHGALIEPFMPVPGSSVGVAISSYEAAQPETSAFPGSFLVRLSTFSSREVAVGWSVIGKTILDGPDVVLATGTLAFSPGEIFKTITPVVGTPQNYAMLRVALANPVNAEVTGEAWYFKSSVASGTLISRGSGGWRYRETRSDPPADWKTLGFDDSSASATEWLPCTLPAGFAVSGVTYGTTVGYGSSSSDKTRTYYFRKKFTIADPAQVDSLTFTVRRDDGAVVWLNNDATATVVSADGTFAAPYSYSSLAPNATTTGTYHTFQIPVSKLVAGENILAVELHQTSITSSDLLLDCDLKATYKVPLKLNLTSAGDSMVLHWEDGGAILEQSQDLQQWTPVPGGTSPVPVNDESADRAFFRLRK